MKKEMNEKELNDVTGAGGIGGVIGELGSKDSDPIQSGGDDIS